MLAVLALFLFIFKQLSSKSTHPLLQQQLNHNYVNIILNLNCSTFDDSGGILSPNHPISHSTLSLSCLSRGLTNQLICYFVRFGGLWGQCRQDFAPVRHVNSLRR